jgi:hypothetical protein
VVARLIQACTHPTPQVLAISNDLDWQSVLALARYNQIVPLICQRLFEYASELPPDILRSLGPETAAIVGWNLKLAGALLTALNVLRSGGIHSVPFKGPVLSCTLYGSLSLRQTRDLDMFVERSQLADALRLLETIGYQLADEYRTVMEQATLDLVHKVVLVVNQFTGVNMDIHWAACEPGFDELLSAANFWSGGGTTTLLGEQVPIPSPENLFVLLVIHGARHHWNSLRLLCDVAWLLSKHPGLKFEVVAEKMPGLWRTRMFLVPLALVQQLWQVDLPVWIELRIAGDAIVQEQARALVASLFSVGTDTNCARKAAEVLVLKESMRLDSANSTRDRLNLLLRTAKRLVLPNKLDREYLGLANRWSFISYVIRPVRVLRTYGFRLCLVAARRLWNSMAGWP